MGWMFFVLRAHSVLGYDRVYNFFYNNGSWEEKKGYIVQNKG